MCLSVPAQIIKIEGQMADVSIGGALFKAGLQMVENVRVGDYILLHAGFAIQKISEEDALETIKLLKEMNDLENIQLP
ncbi:MAG: hydrogenase assembly protein HypC [Bacteroidetes bacterium RBG_19FT_COMBO_42_7]|jgi:hydrogenase expression/formation protein HypC|nr:MAG: hydrogenase assembly protein HypC [Bacteroidetes bacterium RBG_13_42_15]OFY82324.1 MAG: hydrogenase assembly protein HypC [Bacteroidetes bacterium RBG_19FT_COMBO_42_7]